MSVGDVIVFTDEQGRSAAQFADSFGFAELRGFAQSPGPAPPGDAGDAQERFAGAARTQPRNPPGQNGFITLDQLDRMTRKAPGAAANARAYETDLERKKNRGRSR
jgi:hypothetical protein